MKHIILGTGNLGNDLSLELKKRGIGHALLGRTGGSEHGYFDFSGLDGDSTQRGNKVGITMRDLAGMRPEVIWCTVGAGGPGGMPVHHFNAHVNLPLSLAAFAPALICFSTAYLNHDPEGHFSDYALSKRTMERAMLKRDNVRCLRVGSLYGTHAPLKSFPGRMIRAFNEQKLTSGALNLITPTPTAWLAEQLVEMEIWKMFGSVEPGVNIAPSGFVTPNEWIQQIIEDYTGEPMPYSLKGFIAPEYPANASAGSILNPDWLELWKEYGPEVIQAASNTIKLGRS